MIMKWKNKRVCNVDDHGYVESLWMTMVMSMIMVMSMTMVMWMTMVMSKQSTFLRK